MKILQVINCFQRSGGAEKFVLDLSVALKRINNDIEVLSLVPPNKDNNDFIDILKKHKIKFHCLQGNSIRSIKVIQNLGTFFRSHHYDIVHCHLFPALYYCALYRHNIPKLFYTEHNTDNKRRHIKIFRAIDSYFYNKYDRIFCISDQTKKNLISYIPNLKTTIINNGINIQEFQNANRIEKNDLIEGGENYTLIVMAARFVKCKDHITLFNALKFLPENVHIICLGNGELEEKRKQYCIDNNLQNRVHFLGLRKDVKNILKTADVKKIVSIKQKEKKSDNKIAVLYAEGTIIDEASSSSPLSGDAAVITEEMAKKLRKLQEDEDVKAVVFRVNSPGGSAYVSEQIWKGVVDLKAEKPVVVSMGDYAASGGYYISCAADKIVAERTTLTGSIGVFGVFRNFAGTFEKVGLTTDIVKTNTYADLGDFSRPMREDEKALIQHSVEQTYDLFLTRCADGRGMAKTDIDSIGQGRVWTGEQALERGLVDELGGLDTAIKVAAELAGLSDYKVTVSDAPKDFLTKFMEKQLDEAKVSIAKSVMGQKEFELFSKIRQAETEEGILARMPFDEVGF